MIFRGILTLILTIVSNIAFNSIPATPDIYVLFEMMFLFRTYLFEPCSFIVLAQHGQVTAPVILVSTAIATFMIGIQLPVGAKIGDCVEDHV
jgi:hypothetical protein